MSNDVDDPQAGLKRALASAVAHARIQRSKGRSGKSTSRIAGIKKPKKPKKGGAKKPKAQRTGGELTNAERKEVNAVVSTDTQRHGIYEPMDFKMQEVTERGERTTGTAGKEKTVRVVINRGGTAIERWHRSGRIDERQMTAVAIYQGAWRVHIGEPRIVANWSAVIVRQAVAALELRASTKHDAKNLLRLFDQDIFFRRGVDDFNVWQNVVIFDEAAGIAGSRLGYKSKQAEAVAQFVVGSVAHEIACLVVDQSPPDLTQLLFNIDTPRKPRRLT